MQSMFATTFLVAASTAVWTSRLIAPDSSRFAPRSPAHWTEFSRPALTVDLNHDSRPDTVEIVAGERRGTIHVQLDGVGSRELQGGFDRARGGFVYAADVNRDDNLDLVLEYKDGLVPANVWLGDGKGNFVLAAASNSSPDDLYTVPAGPLRPFSSSRSQRTGWSYSAAAEKQARTRVLRRSTSEQKAIRQTRKHLFSRETPLCTSRELLLWIARTINAPPSPSLHA